MGIGNRAAPAEAQRRQAAPADAQQKEERGIGKKESGGGLERFAIVASGAGTNADKIIQHFKGSSKAEIALIVCNKPGAGVLAIAARENIPVILIEKERFFRGDAYIPELLGKKVDLIVLAGFLWKIPDSLIAAYRGRIINIHPALLPKYGGKGMYGDNVHAAVIAAGDKETGITIHYVDEKYDNGDIIYQARCPVHPDDTPASLAKRVHELEYMWFPKVIEELVGQAASS
ncbi:MAG: phosphoribosylglycinamide formyltransferase [Chitinophagaceae bacterium]|nr:phosphoribosylglycinamide formyltransferase [Chitinophagaceae bacterium]